MTDTKEKTTKFWAWIGKIATLAGLIWILIQGISFFSKKDYKIEAFGDYSEFSLPYSLIPNLRDFVNSFEYDSLQLLVKVKYKGDKHEILENVLKYFYSRFPSRILNRSADLNSYYFFTIKNSGNKEVNEIILELPFNGFFLISKAGSKPEFGEFEEKIIIGSIRPSNEVKVDVWTSWNGYFDKSKTKITHPNGVVKITYPRRVRGLLAFVDEYSLLIIFLFVATSMIALILYILKMSKL
jgi:hypothetical protein